MALYLRICYLILVAFALVIAAGSLFFIGEQWSEFSQYEPKDVVIIDKKVMETSSSGNMHFSPQPGPGQGANGKSSKDKGNKTYQPSVTYRYYIGKYNITETYIPDLNKKYTSQEKALAAISQYQKGKTYTGYILKSNPSISTLVRTVSFQPYGIFTASILLLLFSAWGLITLHDGQPKTRRKTTKDAGSATLEKIVLKPVMGILRQAFLYQALVTLWLVGAAAVGQFLYISNGQAEAWALLVILGYGALGFSICRKFLKALVVYRTIKNPEILLGSPEFHWDAQNPVEVRCVFRRPATVENFEIKFLSLPVPPFRLPWEGLEKPGKGAGFTYEKNHLLLDSGSVEKGETLSHCVEFPLPPYPAELNNNRSTSPLNGQLRLRFSTKATGPLELVYPVAITPKS